MNESHAIRETIYRLIRADAPSGHLSYETLEAWVDGRLSGAELELARGHAQLCGQCRSELEDLAQFAAAMNPAVPRLHALGLAERGLTVSRPELPKKREPSGAE